MFEFKLGFASWETAETRGRNRAHPCIVRCGLPFYESWMARRCTSAARARRVQHHYPKRAEHSGIRLRARSAARTGRCGANAGLLSAGPAPGASGRNAVVHPRSSSSSTGGARQRASAEQLGPAAVDRANARWNAAWRGERASSGSDDSRRTGADARASKHTDTGTCRYCASHHADRRDREGADCQTGPQEPNAEERDRARQSSRGKAA
jgi:hypothetical protein